MSYYAKRFFGQQGIITDGLKLWLDAGNPLSYPGSGTTWFDLSGNGNNGTMVNGVVPLSNAMQFDGVNDYVNLGSPIGLNVGLGDFSFGCWFKLNSSSNASIFAKSSARSYIGRWFIIIEKGYLVCVFQATSTTSYSYSTPVSSYVNSGFHNACITIKRSGNMIVYIDNVVKYSVDISSTYNSDATSSDLALIGAYPNSTGGLPQVMPLNGSVNDNFVYSRALIAEEVRQNYNATKSKYGL